MAGFEATARRTHDPFYKKNMDDKEKRKQKQLSKFLLTSSAAMEGSLTMGATLAFPNPASRVKTLRLSPFSSCSQLIQSHLTKQFSISH